MGTAVSRGTKGVRERWREGGREGGGGTTPYTHPHGGRLPPILGCHRLDYIFSVT